METQNPNTQGAKFDKSLLIKNHPELHHYTTATGFSGILKTNTVWATHFSELNDSSEVKFLKEPLVVVLAARCRHLVMDRQRKRGNMEVRIKKFGGLEKVATGLARDFVESIYKVTFDGEGKIDFGSPFVASFCSHAGDQTYEKENGLLSQWRGYGRDGGYCIVFETARLIDLLAKEFLAFDYVHMNIDSARYGQPNGEISSQFPELIDRCEKIISEVLDRNKEASVGDGLSPFLEGATLFKHRGFYEEREVRVVAMPSPKELQEESIRRDSKFAARPIKQINIDALTKRRHITLFEGLDLKLPIKRVIVGPSRNAKDNILNAVSLAEGQFRVTTSATPYIDKPH